MAKSGNTSVKPKTSASTIRKIGSSVDTVERGPAGGVALADGAAPDEAEPADAEPADADREDGAEVDTGDSRLGNAPNPGTMAPRDSRQTEPRRLGVDASLGQLAKWQW
jgi:hypothetical protein